RALARAAWRGTRVGGDRPPTAVAAAVNAEARAVGLGPITQEVDRARCVDVEATVGVGIAVHDVIHQQTGVAWVVLAVGAQFAARRDTDGGIVKLGPRLEESGL